MPYRMTDNITLLTTSLIQWALAIIRDSPVIRPNRTPTHPKIGSIWNQKIPPRKALKQWPEKKLFPSLGLQSSFKSGLSSPSTSRGLGALNNALQSDIMIIATANVATNTIARWFVPKQAHQTMNAIGVKNCNLSPSSLMSCLMLSLIPYSFVYKLILAF